MGQTQAQGTAATLAGFVTLDASGRSLTCDPCIGRALGWDGGAGPAEMTQLDYLARIEEEDRAGVLAALDASRDTGGALVCTHRVRDASGRLRTVNFSGSWLYKDNHPETLIGALHEDPEPNPVHPADRILSLAYEIRAIADKENMPSIAYLINLVMVQTVESHDEFASSRV